MNEPEQSSKGNPPSCLTWQEIEEGRVGQLNLPALTPVPTLAERAFLILAREWLTEFEKISGGRPPPRSVDERALSCLLLTVEWGEQFTDVARMQMETNQERATMSRHVSWLDELPWNLCLSANLMAPPVERQAVQRLTTNLDHHSSSIRCWMMELAWFAIPWLDPVEAGKKLLKNLADTIVEDSLLRNSQRFQQLIKSRRDQARQDHTLSFDPKRYDRENADTLPAAAVQEERATYRAPRKGGNRHS